MCCIRFVSHAMSVRRRRERGPHRLIQICRRCPALGGVMTTAAHRHRPMRFLAVLSGGLGLVLVLAAAASASSSRDAAAGTHAPAGARAAASPATWGQPEGGPGTPALTNGRSPHTSPRPLHPPPPPPP